MKKIFLIMPLLIPNTLFLSATTPSSCATQNAKAIDGTNWDGVVFGRFEKEDYIIDDIAKTVRYYNASGIHATNLVIPDYVMYNDEVYEVYLGERCFYQNNQIVGSVTINKFIYWIPDGCFYFAINITSIIFKRRPLIIGSFAFFQCMQLENIFVISDNVLSTDWLIDAKQVGDWAFFNCSIVGDLQFGADLSYLGTYAFGDCFQIENIDLQSSIKIATLNEATFEGCESLLYVFFPPHLRVISTSCFQSCRQLRYIFLPKTDMNISIGDFAFSDCSQFRSFSKMFTVSYLGESCFAQNESIDFFPFSPTYKLEKIGKNAFTSSNYSAITLDNTYLKDVADNAFSYCEKLAYIRFDGFDSTQAPQWRGINIFNHISDRGEIHLKNSGNISPEWLEFFRVNGIIIDQNHWNIVND